MTATTTPSRSDLEAELAELRVQLATLERQPVRDVFGGFDPVREARIESLTRRSNVIRYTIGLLDEADSHVAAAGRHDAASDRARRQAERSTNPHVRADLEAEARRHRVEREASIGRLEHVRGLLAAEAGRR